MDTHEPGLDSPEARETIDHELDLVESAIDFVLAGGSPRVTLAGLRFGREILRLLPPRGDRVRLEPLWRFDGTGCDILVTGGA